MEKEDIKQEILKLVGQELDQWLDTQSTIKDGYDYEETFMAVSRKVNEIILTKSFGVLPKNRNKKNSRPVLGK